MMLCRSWVSICLDSKAISRGRGKEWLKAKLLTILGMGKTKFLTILVVG
jgi:hypothetical protein